ncbi:hypothetical protein GRF61_21325 [Azoarcus sp. TTM-91]|uniref:DUF6152 family protein n=1 Tax=Azoarcus sp. TTM-91 TaxID=2691581 RepID=UPI00145C9C6E|nr:DUF6152 family protein [Azoarcus sp. TTM-91]NMG37000.1 hypothetical protein [Azoarcus sp. TTM-91]
MDRRCFLFAVGAAGMSPLLARAHHGWSGFDTAAPLYLAGTLESVRWQNPHAELVLKPASGLALPADLAQRSLPAQTAPPELADFLARTRLATPVDAAWTLELAPLSRLNAWKVPPLQAGDTVEAIGYRSSRSGGPLMRVEYLFHRGQAYGLRSSPA